MTGKILVAAGLDSSSTGLQSAEICSPPGGSCVATAGSMIANRGGKAAAVKLSDGRVLFVGGTGALVSAEIYDPGTDTFTATAGSMTAGRSTPQAVLLTNGQVLVVGGFNAAGNTALTSAEIYNPSTDLFTSTGAMTDSRGNGFTATLLQSGKVLVAGGNYFSAATLTGRTTAEVYDPDLATFGGTLALTAQRYNHAALLLPNGNVLLAGGGFLVGGTDTAVATAELYDPLANSFAATGGLTQSRELMVTGGVMLPNGKALIIGGALDSCQLGRSSSELYNPTAGTFAASANMAQIRNDHGITLLPDGSVFVSGGRDKSCGGGMNYWQSTEIFQ